MLFILSSSPIVAYWSNIDQHWFMQWPVTCSTSNHHLKQCWFVFSLVIGKIYKLWIKLYWFSFKKMHFQRYRQKYPTVWSCDKTAGDNNFVSEIRLVPIIFSLKQLSKPMMTHFSDMYIYIIFIFRFPCALVILYPLYSQYIPHGASVMQMFYNRYRCNIIQQNIIPMGYSNSTGHTLCILIAWSYTEMIEPAVYGSMAGYTRAPSHNKDLFPSYGDSHVKDKTVVRPSYL